MFTLYGVGGGEWWSARWNVGEWSGKSAGIEGTTKPSGRRGGGRRWKEEERKGRVNPLAGARVLFAERKRRGGFTRAERKD